MLCRSIEASLETEIFEVARTLLSAVKSLHSLNLIHRDIKPTNIFSISIGHEPGNFYVLGDLEIAKSMHDDSAHVTGGTGTFAYLSPE